MQWRASTAVRPLISLQGGVADPQLHSTYSDALGLSSYMDVISMEEAASLVCVCAENLR